MKKLFTLFAGLTAALALQAQDDFPLQFAYSDGTVIPDGTTLTLTEAETDDFGDVQLPTHLYVKNISTGDVQGGGTYTIMSLSSGIFQTCFPVNCVQQKSTGTFTTGNENFAAGELRNMQTEWMPAKEGTAVVSYQLMTYKKNVITQKWIADKYGPTLTLNFAYGESSAVNSLQSGRSAGTVSYCDLQGRSVSQPRHGIFIKRVQLSDGSVSTQKVNVQ